MKKPITVIVMIVGLISLAIGIAALLSARSSAGPALFLGIVLLLHSGPCLVSSFLRLPLHGCYIDDFIRERSMTRRNKIKTLAVGTALLAAAFFALEPIWAKIAVVVIMVIKYYYIVFCVWIKIEDRRGPPKEDERGGE